MHFQWLLILLRPMMLAALEFQHVRALEASACYHIGRTVIAMLWNTQLIVAMNANQWAPLLRQSGQLRHKLALLMLLHSFVCLHMTCNSS